MQIQTRIHIQILRVENAQQLDVSWLLVCFGGGCQIKSNTQYAQLKIPTQIQTRTYKYSELKIRCN